MWVNASTISSRTAVESYFVNTALRYDAWSRTWVFFCSTAPQAVEILIELLASGRSFSRRCSFWCNPIITACSLADDVFSPRLPISAALRPATTARVQMGVATTFA